MTAVNLNKKDFCCMKRIFFLIVTTLLFSSPIISYAQNEPIDYLAPKLIVPRDIYVESKIPIRVNFTVKAVDDVDGNVPVQCDRGSGSVFKIGKTTVRCEAIDSSGNVRRASFIVTVGYDIVQIPSWIKQTTKFWTSGMIDDKVHAEAVGFLIQEKIIKVPFAKTPNYVESEIPVWIKTNAQDWVDGHISDDEYSITLQWLINRGIIRI